MNNLPYTFKLNDKETYPVRITFSKLLSLKKKNKSMYEKYNDIIIKGAKDIFDYAYIVYIGYVNECNDKPMSFEEFIDKMDYDMPNIISTVGELVNSKKK